MTGGGERQRLFHRECAVGIDKQFVVPDRALGRRDALGILVWLAPDFHFDETATVALDPAGELIAQPFVRIAGETAATVNRRTLAAAAEQDGERQVECARFEIPKRRIDGGDGAGGKPIETIPGRPRLRVRSTIAFQQAAGDMASRPCTTSDNKPFISVAVA